jgi:hypothetical protein
MMILYCHKCGRPKELGPYDRGPLCSCPPEPPTILPSALAYVTYKLAEEDWVRLRAIVAEEIAQALSQKQEVGE